MRASERQKLVESLQLQVEALHSDMVQLEKDSLPAELAPNHLAGARNLLHYVALRRHDIRELQKDLAKLGLSSLGRTESHVLGTIQTVLQLLTDLSRGENGFGRKSDSTWFEGKDFLDQNTEVLLGPPPGDRKVHIMVTVPSEAATDYSLVRALLEKGMNCMRINCAHDGPAAWAAMIANLRRAQKELNAACKVEMDLEGPKLRTGALPSGPAVIKYRPVRDAFGKVRQPARIWLTATEHPQPAPTAADACLPVSERWLEHLQTGSRIQFTDCRDARRGMVIHEKTAAGCWADADRTAYIKPGLLLSMKTPDGRVSRAHVGALPARPQPLLLHPGDLLLLTRDIRESSQASEARPASIGVTLPQFFDSVKPGQPIWFDDGGIGGVIEKVTPDVVTAKIVHALAGGQKLGAEKGINIPETDLPIPALTTEDRANLEFAVAHADIVGLSFVRTAADVRELRTALAALNGAHLGIMLKIETRAGFENLPQLLLESMRSRAVGVMIARGDLAVECGYLRLAELQEEILWIAEAAHVPVVWATQVLESLAKTGRPSRSEITDAAMGERAECVMLNKGPYITEAVRALHDILVRMQDHQEKKTSMLRKLHVAAAFTPTEPGYPATGCHLGGPCGAAQSAGAQYMAQAPGSETQNVRLSRATPPAGRLHSERLIGSDADVEDRH
jgi:pyruvate kinase